MYIIALLLPICHHTNSYLCKTHSNMHTFYTAYGMPGSVPYAQKFYLLTPCTHIIIPYTYVISQNSYPCKTDSNHRHALIQLTACLVLFLTHKFYLRAFSDSQVIYTIT